MKVSNLCWLHGIPFPQSTKDSILVFIDKMREFKELSSFDEFYQNRILLYDTIIKHQEAKVSLSTLVSSIEEFFGWGLPGYHLVLVPMMWPGGISAEYKEQCKDSIGHSYIFIGPKRVTESRPDFGTEDEYMSVVLHEFIHPFVMNYCIRHRSIIEQYSGLYQGNQEVYQNNAIPDWFSAVNEIMTRTVEIILHAQTNKEKLKELIDYQSKELGFKYIPILYDAIGHHYPNDNRSSISWDDVFIDIVASFGKADKNILSKIR